MAKLSDTEVDNWLEKQWSETDPRTRSNLLAELTAKDSTIAALTAELATTRNTALINLSVATERGARIAVLEKALRPFAEGEKLFNDWCPDETPAWYLDNEGDDTDHSSVTVGDFRRARAARGDSQ